MPIPAILLAAGASRRLGQPKQLVRIGTETLLDRTLSTIRESGAAPILVVLGANRERILAEVDLSGVEIVSNPDWEQGIASSIQTGIHALAPAATAAMLLVCDQPQLTPAHLRSLISSFEQAHQPSIAASTYAGIAGIPAIFPASQFPHLLALQGDTGARRLLKNPAISLIAVPFEGGATDIDTPDDLALL